jgi:hypothetical protein
MGIFSAIGDAFKSVFKGIAKIFAPILKPLGKLMNSSFGKALMIGLSIFTLGTAMVAGYAAFTANMAANGFMTAFVEGGKAFLTTLTGVGGGEGGMLAPNATTSEAMVAGSGAAADATALAVNQGGSAGVAGQSGIAGAESGGALAEGAAGSGAFGPGATGDVPMSAVTAGGGPATGQGAMLPEMAGDAAKVADLTAKSSGIQATGESGGWLSKAAEGAKEFAMSDGGGQIVGSLIQGVGNYYTEKDRQEFEDRVRKDWMNPNSKGVANVRAQSGRVGRLQIPNAQDIARTSRTTAQGGGGRPTFERGYGAAAQPAGG